MEQVHHSETGVGSHLHGVRNGVAIVVTMGPDLRMRVGVAIEDP
jgi:hypothetical protein